MEIDLMVILLEGKDGKEFQAYMERYLEVKYGSRFERTVENGRKGDGGEDFTFYKNKSIFIDMF
ncbi:hypothetical protein [Chryseobacterium sp.]|uniref:hypothetical protein n=1 Tax=Chryseobacterium sp. TaxID=1871047 RepID=UPI00260D359B|nr:hypothetical protein [Chryseobacterium sp.]